VNTSRIARNCLLFLEWRNLIDGYGATLITLDGGEIAPPSDLIYRLAVIACCPISP
jgi:hypothetical protein